MKNATQGLKLTFPRPRSFVFQPASGRRLEGRVEYIPPTFKGAPAVEVARKPNGCLALVVGNDSYVDLPIGTRISAVA